MKKSLHIMLIAAFVYVLFSLTSVYAESTIPMVAVTYRLENDGRYKSLKGTTFTSDDDSIDFTYKTTVNGVEKTYTSAFIKNGNVFSYTYNGSKTSEDAYYQALLNDVAVNAMFFAIGNASALSNDYLTDMAKDFSKYNYTNYGLEIKTYDYTGVIDGKDVSIKAVESFKMNAKELSVSGTANIAPVVDEAVVSDPVAKGNEFKSLVLGIILVLVVLLIIALAIKSKNTKTAKTTKKAVSKKTTTKKTK